MTVAYNNTGKEYQEIRKSNAFSKDTNVPVTNTTNKMKITNAFTATSSVSII